MEGEGEVDLLNNTIRELRAELTRSMRNDANADDILVIQTRLLSAETRLQHIENFSGRRRIRSLQEEGLSQDRGANGLNNDYQPYVDRIGAQLRQVADPRREREGHLSNISAIAPVVYEPRRTTYGVDRAQRDHGQDNEAPPRYEERDGRTARRFAIYEAPLPVIGQIFADQTEPRRAVQSSRTDGSCAICLDEFVDLISSPVHLTGGSLCSGCLKHLFERATQIEGDYPAKFFNRPLDADMYAKELGPELFKAYKEKGREFRALPINRVYCTSPCENFVGEVQRDPAENLQAIATCKVNACGKLWCLVCGINLESKEAAIEHSGCKFDIASREREKEESLMGLTRGKDYQICPKCGRTEQLVDACNHMNCPCGEQYCYVCGQHAKEGTGHWNPADPNACPRYLRQERNGAFGNLPARPFERGDSPQPRRGHRRQALPHETQAFGGGEFRNDPHMDLSRHLGAERQLPQPSSGTEVTPQLRFPRESGAEQLARRYGNRPYEADAAQTQQTAQIQQAPRVGLHTPDPYNPWIQLAAMLTSGDWRNEPTQQSSGDEDRLWPSISRAARAGLEEFSLDPSTSRRTEGRVERRRQRRERAERERRFTQRESTERPDLMDLDD